MRQSCLSLAYFLRKWSMLSKIKLLVMIHKRTKDINVTVYHHLVKKIVNFLIDNVDYFLKNII